MPRRELDRSRIVAAAFLVLERAGLAGVTARAVAAELGVQAGAIYYHLPDMATLYDEMATELQRRMVGRVAVPRTWDGLLRAYGDTVRAELLAVRDGGRLFAGRRLRDPALLATMEAPLALLTRAGLPLEDSALVLQTVRDLTAGYVIEEQHRASLESGEYDPAARTALIDATSTPLTAAVSGTLFADPDARFAFALDLVIAGVRARIADAEPG